MTDPDLTTWLSIADAATRIGCSTRTVERLGRAKHLEQRLRPQKGSPPVVVYNPDDVARIAALRRPTPPPFVLDAVGTGNGNGHAAGVKKLHAGTELAHAHGPTDADLVRQFVTLAIAALQSPPSPPVAETVAATSYLTLAEAAAEKRVSEALVRRWIRTGALVAEREPRSQWTATDRGWRIKKQDLETL
jgi:transposase-like protein